MLFFTTKLKEVYSFRRLAQHKTGTPIISAHTHAYTDVVLMVSDRCCLFYFFYHHCFPIIPLLVGLTIRDSQPLVWLTVCLIGWLLVCLIVAYIVLMLVLGLSDQQNEQS